MQLNPSLSDKIDELLRQSCSKFGKEDSTRKVSYSLDKNMDTSDETVGDNIITNETNVSELVVGSAVEPAIAGTSQTMPIEKTPEEKAGDII